MDVFYSDGTRAGVISDSDSWKSRYIGSLIYTGEYGGEWLSSVVTSDGFISYDPDLDVCQMQYFLRDHLGSVRVIAADRNTVLSRSDYLPFGVRMTGNGLNEGSGRSSYFGFGGKENAIWNLRWPDDEMGSHWDKGERYQHFGARTYDPATCTFMQIDPMAEKYYGLSPYSYCAGNPVMYVDPDGTKPRMYVETQRLEHAFVTTGEGRNLIIYTMGRTGNVPEFFKKIGKPGLSPCGEGVLSILRGEAAKNYLEERMGSGVTYSIFEFDGDDSKIDEYYNSLFINGTPPTGGISEGKDFSKVISGYNVLYKNCVTTAVAWLLHAGIDIVSERGTLNS